MTTLFCSSAIYFIQVKVRKYEISVPWCSIKADMSFYKPLLFLNIKSISVHLLLYIYTPSVFCYDKHKKNFDIQFSMKRHETV